MSLFLQMAATQQASAGGVDLTNSLEWWFDLDDSSAATLTEQHNSAFSVTKNSSPTTEATAPDGGNCIDFDSQSEYYRNISLAVPAWFDSDFTINIWARSDGASPVVNTPVAYRNNGTNGVFLMGTQNSSNSSDISRFYSDNEVLTISDTEESLSTWQMLTMVKSGLNLIMYRNGVQIATDTLTSATCEASGGNVAFAFATFPDFISTTVSHNGALWCFGAWSRVLDTNDLSALYNSGSGKKYADL